MNIEKLLAVSIDFDRSHLLFPTIILIILAALLLALAIRQLRGRALAGPNRQTANTIQSPLDKKRFYGTLLLTPVYFVAMEHIGLLFPNTGLGFLLASIPFVLLLSLLYMHDKTTRKVRHAALNAVLCPVAVWFILSELFNISLP